MKKLISTFLAIAMIASLVACSSGETNTSDSNSTTSEIVNSESSETSNEKITLIFGEHVANVEDQSPYIWAIAQNFMEEHPNVTIEFQGSEGSEHATKMQLAAQSNTLPDLFYLDIPLAKQMYEQGYLYDMAPQAEERGILDCYQDGLLDPLYVDTALIGLPSEVMMPCFYYNKAILEECGVQLPETYDDLKTIIPTLIDKGYIPISKGAKNSTWAMWNLSAFIVRYGYFEHYDNIMIGQDSFVNDDFINGYEKVKELTEMGAFPENVATLDYFQSVEMFMGGQAAFLEAGAWESSKLDQCDIASDIGVWFGPTFSDGVGEQKQTIKTVNGPFVISKESANDPAKEKVLMDFFEFYSSTEGTKIVAEETNILPVAKYNGTIDHEAHPVFAQVVAAFGDEWVGTPEPKSTLPTSTATVWEESFWSVINGINTPEEAAQSVQDELETELG